jgi:hypothetical protein
MLPTLHLRQPELRRERGDHHGLFAILVAKTLGHASPELGCQVLGLNSMRAERHQQRVGLGSEEMQWSR